MTAKELINFVDMYNLVVEDDQAKDDLVKRFKNIINLEAEGRYLKGKLDGMEEAFEVTRHGSK